MRDTDKDWEELAKHDPYWAVITKDEYLGAHMDEAARAAFFSNGEGTIAHSLGVLSKHFDCPDRFDIALDFGCGVGRLLMPLARRSRIAVGVDVASAMLAECEKNALGFGIRNIALVRSDDRLSYVQKYAGQVTFLASLLVFQHIPPSRGLVILNGLLDVLSPACFGCIQLVTGTTRPARLAENHPGPIMLMHPYDLNTVVSVMHSKGIKDIFCSLSDHDGFVGVILYFRR